MKAPRSSRAHLGAFAAVCLGLALAAGNGALAQVAPQPPTDAASATPERTTVVPVTSNPGTSSLVSDSPTVVLSPFQVDASRDVGFVAASSLAGGRMSTDLKDTPIAYSVLTREFIDALHLTNLTDASQWMVNTGSTATNGIEDINGTSDVNLTFRGATGPGLQRNYFRLGINYDSYNVDRIDQARGPNSILFGTGNIAGMTTVITKIADPNSARQALEVSYGSWNNLRGTVDVNQPVSQTVAVRANAVLQNSDGWRGDNQWDRKKAGTLAGTWNVLPNTQIRAEGEVGLIERNTPGFGFNDRFSGWDGKTVFPGNATTLPSNAGALGVQRIGSATAPVFMDSPGTGVINIGNTATTLGGGQTATTPMGGIPIVGTGLQAAGFPTLPEDAAIDLPVSRFNLATQGSKFQIPRDDFFVGGTNLPTMVQKYQSYTGFVTQKVGDLFLEGAAFYGSDTRRNNYIAGNAFYDTYIDINQTLPSGAPNPQFLEPYNEQIYTNYVAGTQNRSLRGSAAYILKGTRFGDYSFDVMGGYDEQRSLASWLIDVVKLNADHALWSSANQIRFRDYWDQNNRPVDVSSSVDYNGQTYATGQVPYLSQPTQNARTENQDKYVQAFAKARWFNGRVHVLAAVRRDIYSNSSTNSEVQGDYPTNWDGKTIYYAPAAPPDWTSLTYVPKDANGNPTGPAVPATSRPRDTNMAALPQYANDRFQDDYNPPGIHAQDTTYSLGTVVYLYPSWLSAFYNYATTFNPNSSRLRINGQIFSPQTAFGSDVGLRANVGSRVSISLSAYRGSLKNEAFDTTATLGTALNQMINAPVTGDFSSGGRNARGLSNVPNQFFDSRDRETSGEELEIIANPLRGWRIMLNGSIDHAYQLNAYADFNKYWATNQATFRQVVADAGGTINASNQASTTATSATSPGAAAAVAGWNTVQTQIQNIVPGKQQPTRLIHGIDNLYTDYEFQSGLLKRLRIGAGANYRGREVIGYHGGQLIADPNNPSASIADPNSNPYQTVTAKPYTVGTATLAYRLPAYHKTQINLALKVDNVLNYDLPRYYNTLLRPPGGDLSNAARIAVPGQFYYINPRTFTFTVTFKH